jgi:hypothetical protein
MDLFGGRWDTLVLTRQGICGKLKAVIISNEKKNKKKVPEVETHVAYVSRPDELIMTEERDEVEKKSNN